MGVFEFEVRYGTSHRFLSIRQPSLLWMQNVQPRLLPCLARRFWIWRGRV